MNNINFWNVPDIKLVSVFSSASQHDRTSAVPVMWPFLFKVDGLKTMSYREQRLDQIRQMSQ